MACPPTRRACLVAVTFGSAAAQARMLTHAPVMTRLGVVFLDREITLFEAEAAGDHASLERLLAPDFEQRVATVPGRLLPRAVWLAERAVPVSQTDLTIEHMAVHDLGDAALVSFSVAATGAAPRFVVDLWRRAGADWKLHVRYASPT